MYILLFALSFLYTAPDPAIVLWETTTEHDFGTVHKDHPVWFTFTFKNITQEPVLLETVRTTCGCTAASWTEEPILPGGKGEIHVEFDAYAGGTFKKKLRVFFKQQKKPEILWISGEVE